MGRKEIKGNGNIKNVSAYSLQHTLNSTHLPETCPAEPLSPPGSDRESQHGFLEMAAGPWFWDGLGFDFAELKGEEVETMRSPPTRFHLLLLATSFPPFPSLPAGAALPHLPSWGGGPALSSSRAGAKGMNNVMLRGQWEGSVEVGRDRWCMS